MNNTSTLVNPYADYINNYSNPVLGCVYVMLALIWIVIYLPCLIVMARKPLIEHSSFKIMVLMATIDFGGILNGGLICGFFSIISLPMDKYFTPLKLSGAFANGLWFSYCATAFLLALNRCVTLKSDWWNQKLFGGYKTNIWIAAIVIYFAVTVIFIMFNPWGSIAYHSGLAVYFLDPIPGQWLALTMNLVHNWLVSICLPIAYILVYYFLKQKTQNSNNQAQTASKERTVALTAIIISSLVIVTAISYVTLPLIISDPRLFCIGNFFWNAMIGCNPFIYLALNPTIRNGVLKLFGLQLISKVGPASGAASRKTRAQTQKTAVINNQNQNMETEA